MRKFIIIVGFLSVIIFLSRVGASIDHKYERQEKDQNVTLDIKNTFPISVILETKCDIIPGTFNKYKFFKRITIPKNGRYLLKVPNNLKYCECWTISYKLF
jgi:hypothetical protein